MNKLITFIFIIAYAGLSAQNYEISGIVVANKLNEPIPGAHVLLGTSKGSLTDENGYFEIKTNEKAGQLTVKYLGYEELTIPIEWTGNTMDLGKIQITEKDIQLKEVVVSGPRMPYKASIESTNYYISPKIIKEIQPMSTEELLRALPGVNVQGEMGLSNRMNVSIRGSWGRRSEKVLILEDGSPVSPAPYIAPGIYYNPISDRIEAMEVYTGADILRYGPNNMFGIINYISPRPPQVPTTRIKVSGGQRGYFTGLMSYGGTWNNVGAQIEGVYKKFDGFVQNSSVEMVNLNAKVFAELGKNQSLYFKISNQFENNQASWSAITPFTYAVDPLQNPFDADRFIMHRYGMDIIHRYVGNSDWSIQSKIFASDFGRQWWRQNNLVIPVAQAFEYLGENIINDRYSYLKNVSFTDEDYVRVGRMVNGRESTADSRWSFSVAGLEETFTKTWSGDTEHQIEANFKIHKEVYTDAEIRNDSTRWAESGRIHSDLYYSLISYSGYLRYQLRHKALSFTPILRLERVQMYKLDKLDISKRPDISGPENFRLYNNFSAFLPGVTLAYQHKGLRFYTSAYQGFIAPSKVFAFLVERNGEIVKPELGDEVNMKPEYNFNVELGVRGGFIPGILQGQVSIFNNRIRNFFLGGRGELFEKLGVVNIQGLEAAFRLDLIKGSVHKLFLQPNITLLRSKVISGEMVDNMLFSSIIHSKATREEFVNKVNANPNGYRIKLRQPDGSITVHEGQLKVEDIKNIAETRLIFGEGHIENAQIPTTPNVTLFLNANYSYKNMSLGVSYNHVGSQFSEFAGFKEESADGALGVVPAFHTIDVNLNYDFKISSSRVSAFLVVKNIENRVFRMSRVNRANSGVFPGGFRQINIGFNMEI